MAAINKNFVVKNGIEVGDNLIYGNNNTGRVGLGTTNPSTDIDLFGTTSVDDLVISGTISVANTTGTANQYLTSTGIGLTWKDFPSLRTGFTTTALGSQTTFASLGFTYTPGLLDVYVNGARLRGNGLSDTSEFTAVDGSTIIFQNPCFGGETVDIFAYSGVSGGIVPFNGITVQEEGSIVGTAQSIKTINFVGTSVTAVGSGLAVTVYINDIDTVNPNYWNQTATGIHTLSNVGVGTTNSRFTLEVGSVGASGTSLWVNGDARIVGILTIGTSSITLDGSTNTINVGAGITIDGATGTINASSIEIAGQPLSGYGVTLITAGSGISIDQSTGNVTITATGGGSGESYWAQTAAGIHTLSNVGIGTTNPISALTINGGIQLAQNNPTIVGTSGTAGEIKRIGGAPFFYDGSAWREFVLSSGTPVSVPADTEWDNVILRCTFDTDFTDSKFGASPVYIGAGSSIVGAAVTIGTGAFRNDGTAGAGISFAYRSDYDFTGSWTFETWIYFENDLANDNPVTIFANKSESNPNANFGLYLFTDGSANKYFNWGNENGTNQVLENLSGSTFDSIFTQKWTHIALVREGNDGSLHFYVNGVESSTTDNSTVIDNNILNVNGTGLYIGGTPSTFLINSATLNNGVTVDAIYDDLRISAGVGTAGQRYTSIGISTYATFTPPTTALPTTGTLSSYVQPPGDKYGEITLGGSPTWRGTSGVTVTQQSSGNYRVSFASTYTNSNDYFVLTQAMDQGFASYVGVARSTTHVDFAINRQSNDAAVDTGSLSVQIKNHI